jgi:hypothetical protein
MNTRLLGSLLIVGALAVIVEDARASMLGTSSPVIDIYSSIFYVIWGIGGVCGVLGLIRLNALRFNAVARAAGFIPLIGFVGFILGDGLRVLGFLNTGDPLYNLFATVAWVAMMAGMLIVGILTIAAKVWQGWRRFVPLITVLFIPVAMGVGIALNNNILVTGIIGWTPWLILGYIIAAAGTSSSVQRNAAV